jgi:hypothetical protein
MGEWAQLSAGPPATTELRRGHWYRVETHTRDGMVLVLGPNGVAIPLYESVVRLIDREPDMITRVRGSESPGNKPRKPTPTVSVYGVCPKGHRIENLGSADAEALCPGCGRKYRVQDEAHV